MKGLLYFYMTENRFSLTVFWIVLLSSMFLSMGIDFVLLKNDINSQMIFALPMALYVYCGIIGFLTVKENIPFSIKIGSTRRNIFFSLGIFFIGISIAMALFSNTIQGVIEHFYKRSNYQGFKFVHLADIINDSWGMRVLVDASFMFFLFSFFFLIGLMFYKYGLLGGGSFVAILVLFLITGFSAGWLDEFIIKQVEQLSALWFGKLSIVTIILYALTWFLLRRITTVHTR